MEEWLSQNWVLNLNPKSFWEYSSLFDDDFDTLFGFCSSESSLDLSVTKNSSSSISLRSPAVKSGKSEFFFSAADMGMAIEGSAS